MQKHRTNVTPAMSFVNNNNNLFNNDFNNN